MDASFGQVFARWTEEDIKTCLDLIHFRYEDHTFVPVPNQGGCSYTAIASSTGAAKEFVLQFRTIDFAVNVAIAQDAARTFPKMAPNIIRCDLLGLSNDVMVQVVEMTMIGGSMYSELMPYSPLLRQHEMSRLKILLGDMADLFATSWYAAMSDHDSSCSLERLQRKSTGLIGSSILERLNMLENGLPSSELRQIAHYARQSFEDDILDVLPMVLNHGDLLPCNIMVDMASWHLTGLVDWAEAEYLPFGMTSYGIEHLLGYMDESNGKDIFVYYRQAGLLRDFFWNSLQGNVEALCREDLWRAVLLSRTIGILLWHGIAWDGGRRDRVVEARSDCGDLSCLEEMLKSVSIPRQFRL